MDVFRGDHDNTYYTSNISQTGRFVIGVWSGIPVNIGEVREIIGQKIQGEFHILHISFITLVTIVLNFMYSG